MGEIELIITIQELAFLQAYLFQVFSSEKQCKKNFDHTEWYFNEKYSSNDVSSIKNYFVNNGIFCDCDIINKFDLRIVSKNRMKFHDD